MPYTPNPDWEDSPSTDTPITAAALQRMEDGIETAQAAAEAAQSTADGAYSAGGTDVPVTDGGTGASTAADARTNLGAAAAASPTFTGTVTLPTGLTGLLRADSGVVSTDSDVTDVVAAASATAAGKVELATVAETDTGTDDTRAVTPAGLAGSALATKVAGIETNADVTDAANVDAAGAVMNSDTSTAAMSFVVDEDTMSSDSATKVPTQQSTKAYVDAHTGDASGAHAASAISVADSGARFAGTDTEACLAEAFDEGTNAYVDLPTMEDGTHVLFTESGSPPSEKLTPYVKDLVRIVGTRAGADQALVQNTTSLTPVFTTGITPAADTFVVDDLFHLEGWFRVTNTSGSAVNLTTRLRCNSNTISATGAVSIPTGGTHTVRFECNGYVFDSTTIDAASTVSVGAVASGTGDTADIFTRTEVTAVGITFGTLGAWGAFDVAVQFGTAAVTITATGGMMQLTHIPKKA